ncbi:MAG: HAD-superfamily hydrolase, subfamily IIB [Parcubacteria group bacterium Greene0714_21]|nr:MAG: HAD-superfamily hydrolase, subfamily IIB [Parcubacteria group bacterium Greene0416_39]TSC97888.1 MAG: HAD-superfamily hydrolase, subfamily IIB [Parcubacteria group bacterium Greene1014_47]TSD03919.1 MAG: HAD-superfamily hydrolase, subfamily IIB [Parcubacteria group bacterium Greene0714_21]
MLNKAIPEEQLRSLKLLVLDSDGVSVPRGTEITEQESETLYEAHIKTFRITDEFAKLLNQLKKKILVCISSGRNLVYLQSMYEKILGGGTILQAENGNLSLIDGTIAQHFFYDEKYFQTLSAMKQDILKLPIKGIEPKQFILSCHASSELKEVYEIVKLRDKNNELKVLWNGEAFDIQKKEVSKGAGLERLMEHLNITREQTIAMGDRVNDKELLKTAGIGVSADKEALPAEYWTEGEGMPGEILARYLWDHLFSTKIL